MYYSVQDDHTSEASWLDPNGDVRRVAEPVGVGCSVADPVGVASCLMGPVGVARKEADSGVVGCVLEPVSVALSVVNSTGSSVAGGGVSTVTFGSDGLWRPSC